MSCLQAHHPSKPPNLVNKVRSYKGFPSTLINYFLTLKKLKKNPTNKTSKDLLSYLHSTCAAKTAL